MIVPPAHDDRSIRASGGFADEIRGGQVILFDVRGNRFEREVGGELRPERDLTRPMPVHLREALEECTRTEGGAEPAANVLDADVIRY